MWENAAGGSRPLSDNPTLTDIGNYCVYLHMDLETYEVVYVGLGQAGRPWDNLRLRKEHRQWMEKQDLRTAVQPILKSATVNKANFGWMDLNGDR